MKKWSTLFAFAGLAAASMVAVGVTASQADQRPDFSQLRERQALARAEHPRPQKAPAKAPASPILSGSRQLYGIGNQNSYDGVFASNPGPAELSLTGAHNRISSSAIENVIAGCYFEGRVLVFQDTSEGPNTKVTMLSYDADSWAEGQSISWTGAEVRNAPADLTWDPETRRIYGAFFDDYSNSWTCGQHLGYLDPDGVSLAGAVEVAPLAINMRGIVNDGKGQLYGIGVDSKIYKINKNTGALTENGSVAFITGLTDEQADPENPFAVGYDAAEMDYSSGDIYFSYNDSEADGFIMKMRPDGSNPSLVYNSGYLSGGNELSELITVLWLKQEVAVAESTPKAPTALTVTPVGTELKANVAFTLPSKDMQDNTLTGNLNWTITSGDDHLASGSGAPGASVTKEVTVSRAGMIPFAVTPSVGSAKGSPAMTNVFVGPDTPVIVSKPEVMVDGRKVSVFWDEPLALNGGNMAPIAYKVVRKPDGKVVAEATSETLVEDNVESPEKSVYSYEVTPSGGSAVGETVSSRQVYVGQYFGLPHTDDFSNESLFKEYPAIDANNDHNTWWFDPSKGCAVYSANSNAADDYLLIGPFNLEQANTYDIEVAADGHSMMEKVAVFVGQGTDNADNYTSEVIPETLCNPHIGRSFMRGSFQPQESGLYYVAVKACSDASTQNLYLYNVKVSSLGADVPAAPENAVVVPGPSSITLKCTLPTKTMGGNKAANLSKVVVYRDNRLIATVTANVADGADFSFTDSEKISDGNHSYRIAAVNANGEGKSAAISAWAGLDTPAKPTNLRIWESIDTDNELNFTMDAPTLGVHGGYIDPNDLTYYVDYFTLSGFSGVVEVGKEPNFSMRLPEEIGTEQTIVSCSVYAKNSAGDSGRQGWNTSSCTIGRPLKLPLRESWAGATQKSGKWGGSKVDENSEPFEALWDVSDGSPSETPSQDGDGYMLSFNAYVDNASYRILTPRVYISTFDTDPYLVFFFRNLPMATDFSVEVIEDDKPIRHLKKIQLDEHGSSEWQRVAIRLSQFKKSEYVQFAFKASSAKAAENVVCIDNVSIQEYYDHKLSCIDFEMPDKATANEKMIFRTTVRNTGKNPVAATDYTLHFTLNKQELPAPEPVDFALDQTHTLEMEYTPKVTDPEHLEFKLYIQYPEDEFYYSGNLGFEEYYTLHFSDLPAPSDLVASRANGINLEWKEPDIATMPYERVTETFDTRQAFSTTDFAPFTLHDGDGASTVVLATPLGALNYPNIGEPMAWQIMDPEAAAILNGAWYARSGKQFAVSFQACRAGGRDTDSDDWLITPELNGEAQTITFFARAGMSAYAPELMDVLYSTTGNSIADFKPLKQNIEVPYSSDWVEYAYSVPEGTKYVAIVHKTYNGLAMLLDDFSYTPMGSPKRNTTLLGYNIYRNGTCINESPVTDTRYVDTETVEGTRYTYHVSALWDCGESRTSNGFSLIASDLESLFNPVNVAIVPAVGAVRIYGANSLTARLFTTMGSEVWSGKIASDDASITLAPGIYIVAVGSSSARILVK